ncbi:MAG: sigma-54-dependent Fis family transcriptional regulator [Candidatus Krumholzibacteria bacterium]|nr:sigma-54-dependent Fis family transcriptional regulator [Candidatus Krumholzibacteria bacterium]
MPCSANILVVDDDESMRIGCVQTLTEEGYRAQSVDNGQRALKAIEKVSFDVIILDLKMPGIPGMEVLKRIKEADPSSIVIIITGYGTIDVAVEAMRKGAYDFITKPFTPEAFLKVVERAVDSRRRELEYSLTNVEETALVPGSEIVGRSAAIMKVKGLIKQVAPTDSTVLVYGGTGVGKELVARNIHHLSLRRDRPFVVVDCGTLVETLFESEMFGHAKGSFTGAIDTTRGKFELADGGTIFLDEITNISIGMQSRLLRVIQEKEISKIGSLERIKVDVRIISATNKDLSGEIRHGRFREDLFYRLNVVPIYLSPLREKREDIPLLAEYFLAKAGTTEKTKRRNISEDAMRFLQKYDWPGNVRQLKNTIEYAVVTCKSDSIGLEDLAVIGEDRTGTPKELEEGSLAQSEKKEIIRALKQFDGHRAKTAEFLGINRKTLREKIRKYSIEI